MQVIDMRTTTKPELARECFFAIGRLKTAAFDMTQRRNLENRLQGWALVSLIDRMIRFK